MNKKEVEKLDMKSMNILTEKTKKLSELFPNVIVESEKGIKIDFELLKQEISSDIVEGGKERYQLTWPGKKEAILEANRQTNRTLRPDIKKSVNFETTNNLYIEGDNLEVLKIIQESYLNSINVIYIDPPYNTGSDFIYNDKFSINKNEELTNSGQIDSNGNQLIANYSSLGRFHSNWISMIYPRLKLARNLLTEDGLIFISIDDNELYNLKKVCDEIFGEHNFICNFIRKTSFGEKTAKPNINKHQDYILCYAKMIDVIQAKDTINGEAKEFESYSNPDNDPNGDWTKDSYLIKIDTGRYGYARYPIHNPYLNITHYPPVYYDENNRKQWHYVEETFRQMEKNGQVVYYKNKEDYVGEYSFFIKKYKKDIDKKNNNISTLCFDDNNYVNAIGTRDIINAFNENEFSNSYPKPVNLIRKIIQYSTWKNKEAIIMDFFSGSGTTAEAIMRENAVDGGNRKFILVQLPEINGKSKYKTICDIGEERIRRVAKKIKEETNANIDYGFRVYRVDSSNMKDIYYEPSKLDQKQLDILETNIKEDRTSEDLLVQVMLNLGLTLDLNIEEKNMLNNKVYFIEKNSLVACFDNKIDIDILDEICKIKPLKIVFRENSFNSDSEKINAYERIRRLSPKTGISVI
ncbi:MAG: site-specific DNA-methyltransferase [Clostridia bacterium]|nr:site-specific DNA-methyltransferase [Clostridia bacterium]